MAEEFATKINYLDDEHRTELKEPIDQNNCILKGEDQIFVLSDQENDVTDFLANLRGMGIVELSTTPPEGTEGKEYIKVEFAPYIKRQPIEEKEEHETRGYKDVMNKLELETISQLWKKNDNLYKKTIYEGTVYEKTFILLKDKFEKQKKTIYVKLNKNFKGKVVNCGDLTSDRSNFKYVSPEGLMLNAGAMWKINDWLAEKAKDNYICVLGNHEVSRDNNILDYDKEYKEFYNRLNNCDYRKLSFAIKNYKGQYLVFCHTGAVDMDKIKKGLEGKNEYIEYIEDEDIDKYKQTKDCPDSEKFEFLKNKKNPYAKRLWARNEDYLDGKIVKISSIKSLFDFDDSSIETNGVRPAMNEGIIFHGHNYIHDNDSYKKCNSDKGYFDVNSVSHKYYMIDKNNLSTIYACDNGYVVNTIKTDIGEEIKKEENKNIEILLKNKKNETNKTKEIENNSPNINIIKTDENNIDKNKNSIETQNVEIIDTTLDKKQGEQNKIDLTVLKQFKDLYKNFIEFDEDGNCTNFNGDVFKKIIKSNNFCENPEEQYFSAGNELICKVDKNTYISITNESNENGTIYHICFVKNEKGMLMFDVKYDKNENKYTLDGVKTHANSYVPFTIPSNPDKPKKDKIIDDIDKMLNDKLENNIIKTNENNKSKIITTNIIKPGENNIIKTTTNVDNGNKNNEFDNIVFENYSEQPKITTNIIKPGENNIIKTTTNVDNGNKNNVKNIKHKTKYYKVKQNNENIDELNSILKHNNEININENLNNDIITENFNNNQYYYNQMTQQPNLLNINNISPNAVNLNNQTKKNNNILHEKQLPKVNVVGIYKKEIYSNNKDNKDGNIKIKDNEDKKDDGMSTKEVVWLVVLSVCLPVVGTVIWYIFIYEDKDKKQKNNNDPNVNLQQVNNHMRARLNSI